MGKTVYLHVPDDMHEWLKNQADAEDRSINNMIVRLLQQVKRGKTQADPPRNDRAGY